MLRLRRLLIRQPLGSAAFQRFQRYYELIRLLRIHRPRSIYKTSLGFTAISRNAQTSQVRLIYLCALTTLLDPGGISTALLSGRFFAVCGAWKHIDFRSILLTGLYRFTLSHCGSRTPLPTLKPHLTALAPRLCTGCLLWLYRGRTLTCLYIKRRTGALHSGIIPCSLFIVLQLNSDYMSFVYHYNCTIRVSICRQNGVVLFTNKGRTFNSPVFTEYSGTMKHAPSCGRSMPSVN